MFSLVSFANLGLALAQISMFVVDTPKGQSHADKAPVEHVSYVKSDQQEFNIPKAYSEDASIQLEQSNAPQVLATYLYPCFKNHPDYYFCFELNPKYPKTYLSFINFPFNQPLGFFDRRQLIPSLDNYLLNNTLILLSDGTYNVEDGHITNNLYIDAYSFLPGERVDFKFLGMDPSFCHEISLIPFRLIADNGQFSAEAEVLSIFPTTTYLITFEGLNEGETVFVKSTSDSEVLKYQFNYSKDQKTIHMPAVINKNGGFNFYEASREDGTSITLRLPWGMEFVKYLQK